MPLSSRPQLIASNDDVHFQPTTISTRRISALIALLATAACQGDAAGSDARPAGSAAKGARTGASNGDVVIAAPTAPYRVAAVSAPGTVSGTISLKGTPPALPAFPTGKEAATCGASMADESVQSQGGGLGNVVVWLEGVRAGKPIGLERRLELESDHCKLVPRVQAAVVGSSVNILGHDDYRQHLAFSAAGDSAARATILLGGGEQVIPTDLPFRAPGMVSVSDKDHAWTRAYLAVFDHPYFAVSTANGTYSIDGVPPGSYTLHAWHERTGTTQQKVEVGANGSVKVPLTLELKTN
ncbi:MAG: carboxypeptidase-like regulatory domain-containing protein [Gemmatimonadaceae bacterium]